MSVDSRPVSGPSAPICLRCGSFCTAEVAIHPGLPLCRACVDGVIPMDPRLRPPARLGLQQVGRLLRWTIISGLLIGALFWLVAPSLWAGTASEPMLPLLFGTVGGFTVGVFILPVLRQRRFEAEAFTAWRAAAMQALGLTSPDERSATVIEYVRVVRKQPARLFPTTRIDYALAVHAPGAAILLRVHEGVEVLTREQVRQTSTQAVPFLSDFALTLKLSDGTQRTIKVLGRESKEEERIATMLLADNLRPIRMPRRS